MDPERPSHRPISGEFAAGERSGGLIRQSASFDDQLGPEEETKAPHQASTTPKDAQITAAHQMTLQCQKAFEQVRKSLDSARLEFQALISRQTLDDEVGRFRVWAGNIGALQKGHSSLDYRLREARLVHENILKLLRELYDCLQETYLVLSGARLPYEQEERKEIEDDDSSSGSSSGSSESDLEEDSPRESPTELRQRLRSIMDIIDTLYKLSRYIRMPTIQARISKAAAFRKVDDDTGIDLFSELPVRDTDDEQQLCSLLPSFDLSFLVDMFCQARRAHLEFSISSLEKAHVTIEETALADLPLLTLEEDAEICALRKDPRIIRLARSNTRRRQQFQYWASHREKLGINADADSMNLSETRLDLNKNVVLNEIDKKPAAPSQVARNPVKMPIHQSAMSETTATFVGPINPPPEDTQSVVSFASTSRGEDGSVLELPSLPNNIITDKDFECPYCFVICPKRYQNPRAWRAHLLRDLRPYVCTYYDCPDSEQRFGTRDEWLHHEEWTHRKLWQCPEHEEARFTTKTSFENHVVALQHISSQHMSIEQMCESCQVVGQDERKACFICHGELPSLQDLQNHMSFHLERIAAFSLPRNSGKSEGNNSVASVGAEAEHRDADLTASSSSETENMSIVLSKTAIETKSMLHESQKALIERINADPGLIDSLLRDVALLGNHFLPPPNTEDDPELLENSIVAMQKIQQEINSVSEDHRPHFTEGEKAQIQEDFAAYHSTFVNLLACEEPGIIPRKAREDDYEWTSSAVIMKEGSGKLRAVKLFYNSMTADNWASEAFVKAYKLKERPIRREDFQVYGTVGEEVTPTHYAEIELQDESRGMNDFVKLIVNITPSMDGIGLIAGRNFMRKHEIKIDANANRDNFVTTGRKTGPAAREAQRQLLEKAKEEYELAQNLSATESYSISATTGLRGKEIDNSSLSSMSHDIDSGAAVVGQALSNEESSITASIREDTSTITGMPTVKPFEEAIGAEVEAEARSSARSKPRKRDLFLRMLGRNSSTAGKEDKHEYSRL